MLIQRASFRITVLVALVAAGFLVPARVQAADCAALRQKRAEAFRAHAATLRSVGVSRALLTDLDTQDPAVIEKRLSQATVFASTARRRVQGSTGQEEAVWKAISTDAEEYLDYWRARKANEISGGMVNLPSIDKFRAYARQRIAEVEQRERAQSNEISDLDRQIQRCHSSSGGSQQPSRWSGTWVSGPYTIVISGGFGSLSYKADRNGTDVYDHATGTCTVKGNEATCKQTGHWHDTERDVDREEDFTLTLSGNTIYAKSRVTSASVTLASGQPCPDPAQCTGFHVGAEFEGTWTRKP